MAAAARSDDEEGGLELVRSGLTFASAETESLYRAWQVERAVPFNRAGMYASIASWVAILAVVGLVLPHGAEPWLAGGALVGLCIVFSLVTTYARRLRRWMAASVMLANTAAGFLAVGITSYHMSTLEGGVLGATIVNYFGFVIFRLRPLQAALGVAPYMCWTAWILAAEPAGGREVAGTWPLWFVGLATAYGSGLLACMVFDLASRQSYRQERIIEAQRRTIAEERARSEALLKQEISHQVAERSRELGQLLARIEASLVVGGLAPGERFDRRYRVVRSLGSGGMGSVYEVERMTDEQRLALKIVTGEVSAAQAARFAREAEIGARVHHRHVLPIVDVGIADGVPFLAMELAEHGSLEEQRARFGDATWALPLLAQIAEGLAALHALGVVHRDLKPANVLFTTAEDGATVAKISDFGISTFGAFVAAEVDPTAPTMSTPDVVRRGITATGALLGTPYYMAPEAIHGAQALTAAADAFAFGILACEMLTGRTPFPAPPFFLALTGEPIATPTVAFDPAIAPAVREAITACLAIEPAGRPALRSLAGLLAGDPTRRAA